ncbi:lytic transglycosylase domain-containing protein [Burkholderia cepacia]|jgi:soluble lytic murein transglycosylase-like protein|uniref:Lytic transglycosylase domain-containing protein n=1 Tax=Burkholderia contaminans TaxID=488447 RepID=A0ABD7YG42_9BURK|nr:MULTISPECIES: lytic transglycosylase domain-containing protein [Burkholderia]MBR8426441.1 lytic transglycosylase domain-containing protein [Burkholderia cenocepacia]EKS9799002.1 lytic transglycosylase domain-containing protein [Burkholderia cepacia]EKS9805956.1 lytic transglycosylase domain-containing protein [Burkholderia cepacia]EKS9813504.1 lytic transglycosylase domain-containing protein [Burkholderia cepacia]EKS9820343.1 lytic transglycosylase domain-containing protein [Burkholderia ce
MAIGIVRDRSRTAILWGCVLALNSLQVVTARADCIDAAAAYQHLNPHLVRAIASVESGFNPSARNVNRNGSEDIGLMQINTSWLPTLARYGIDRAALLDACTNAYVGAWILAQNFATYGVSWNGVGAYNARTPSLRARYALRVYRRLPREAFTSAAQIAPLPVQTAEAE